MKLRCLWSVFVILLIYSYGSAQTIYYVDSKNGSDIRSGTSESTAWKTIFQVNNASLQPGDIVKFKCGGLWREKLLPKSGERGRPITYTSYGSGEKPILQRSVSRSNAGDWVRLNASDNIWYTRHDSLYRDVGNVILNHGEKWGVKQFSLSDLSNNLDFYSSTTEKRLYIFIKEGNSTANPATIYTESIELPYRDNIISIGQEKHDIVVDGLFIRYGGAHGIGQCNTYRTVIRNCDIAWIGGSLHDPATNLRYGNGVEFYCSAEDHLIENNRVWQIFDSALTNQGDWWDLGSSIVRRESVVKNITYRNNIIWKACAAFEFWNRRMEHENDTRAYVENIVFENNICADIGMGWSAFKKNSLSAHVFFSRCSSIIKDVIIRHNVFYRVSGHLKSTILKMYMPVDWRYNSNGEKVLKMDYNQYYVDNDTYPIARFAHVWESLFTTGQYFSFHDYRCSLGLDENSIFMRPVFVDEENEDYRIVE